MGEIIESAEDLLGIDDLETVPVKVKAWKGRVVLLRMPSAFDALNLGTKMKALAKGQETDAQRLVIAEMMVNSKGEKIIDDHAYAELYKKNPRALAEIQVAAHKMLGWSKDKEEAKAEAAKGKDDSPEMAPDSSPTV
jgi:hypothetical protein